MNKNPRVAYFCMEYGLEKDFKIFSGGLGILAGDHLKAAYDLDMPIVAIGIKWKQGYTEQFIGEDGKPYDVFKDFHYDFLEDTGVMVEVNIKNTPVYCKLWKTTYHNNVPLYLLDTDLEQNQNNTITARLYGGNSEDRVAQEIVLGIGGVKALRKLGLDIDVYHFNEGHADFAGLELIREKMESGIDFEQAYNSTREQIVFTTHTPVIAGNESHSHQLLKEMGAYNGLSYEQMNFLGGDPFNMTVAGLRLSRKSNAVAQLHMETANKMWQHVEGRSEIIGITNGVHVGTWVDNNTNKAFNENGDIWTAHMESKRRLIDFVYQRTGIKLSEDKLIIGFSRRAATYKRSNLVLQNEDIIAPYLESGQIQIIFSGKAHPADEGGKSIISNLVAMSKKYPNSIVFLENYDMEIGKLLTSGSDVWLNNPRRPQEASGTSGMKAAMNGVLNLSILDGWWPEACIDGENGWQISDEFVPEEERDQDQRDLKSLYEVLIDRVVPTYYQDRDRWVAMMKKSIETTIDQFSAARMVREYYQLMYTK